PRWRLAARRSHALREHVRGVFLRDVTQRLIPQRTSSGAIGRDFPLPPPNCQTSFRFKDTARAVLSFVSTHASVLSSRWPFSAIAHDDGVYRKTSSRSWLHSQAGQKGPHVHRVESHVLPHFDEGQSLLSACSRAAVHPGRRHTEPSGDFIHR